MTESYKINSVKFDFSMESEEFALDLNSRWNSFFDNSFKRNVDKILSEFDNKNQYIQIDSIELDLGEITQEEFDRKFPDLLKEKLQAKLQEYKFLSNDKAQIKQLSKKEHNLNALTYFLLHGYYPWYLQNTKIDFIQLFKKEIKDHAVQLKYFLLKHGHYSTLKNRLIYHLKNEEINELVSITNKTESSFIISYTQMLLSEQSYSETIFNHREEHRNTVWFIVLTYLFASSESNFNRKEFIHQNISELASHYNLSFNELIEFLVESFTTINVGKIKPNLIQIIKEIHNEVSKNGNINNDEIIGIKRIKGLLKSETGVFDIKQLEFIKYLKQPGFISQLIKILPQHELLQLLDKVNASDYTIGLKQYFEAEITTTIHKNIDNFINDLPPYLKNKKKNEAYPEFLKNEYLKILKQAHYRRKFIESLNEVQTRKLIRIINPTESEFIISYANSLENQKENNHFEGKAGGEFKQLKWEFILTVLIEDHISGLNRKNFIFSVASMLASHYNLKVNKLLSYFYQSIIDQSIGVPPYLKDIISELYFETKEKRSANLEINPLDKEAQETYYAQILKVFIQTGFISNSAFSDKIFANFSYLKTYRVDLINEMLEELKQGFILSDQSSIPKHKELYRELILHTISVYQINLPGGRNVKSLIENLADDRFKAINKQALKTMLLALLRNDVSLFTLAWDLLTEKETNKELLVNKEFKFITNEQIIQILKLYENSGFDVFILTNYHLIFERLIASKTMFLQFIEIFNFNPLISNKIAELQPQKYLSFIQKSISIHFPNEKLSVKLIQQLLPNYIVNGKSHTLVPIFMSFAANISKGKQKSLIIAITELLKISAPNDMNSVAEFIKNYTSRHQNHHNNRQIHEFVELLLNIKPDKKGKKKNKEDEFFKWIFKQDENFKSSIKLNEVYSLNTKKEFESIVKQSPSLILKAVEKYYTSEYLKFQLVFELVYKLMGFNQNETSSNVLTQLIYNFFEGKSNYFEIAVSEIYSIISKKDRLQFTNYLDDFSNKIVGRKVLSNQILELKNTFINQDENQYIKSNLRSKEEYFFQWLQNSFGSVVQPNNELPSFNNELQNNIAFEQFEQILIEQPQLIKTQIEAGKLSEIKLAQWIKSASLSIQYRWLQLIPKSFYKTQINDVFVILSWVRIYFNENNIIYPESKINIFLIDFCSGKYQNYNWRTLASKVLGMCFINIDAVNHEALKIFLAGKASKKGAEWESRLKKLYTENDNSKAKNNTQNQTEKEIMHEEGSIDTLDTIFINNAGLVLCSTYFPRLFDMLGLMHNGQFSNEKSKERAVLILQYLVFENINFSESEMVLNKVICGFHTGVPVDTKIELNANEKDTILQLLNGIIQNWKALGGTSPEGLRGSFLIRDGKLEQKNDRWQLTIETKPYDMLVDKLPWSYTPIKHPWMNKPIHVKWR